MEIEDLMIGDWVSYHGIANKVAPADFCHFEWINEIRPIPLTLEILEKNGFVKVENTQTSTIIYSFRDSLFRIGVFDFNHVTIDSYYTDSSCDVFISSVHELQHALRLCGINKEIKL